MRRAKPLEQSVWMSLGLMAVLFFLPLAVIAPFRHELLEKPEEQREEAAPPLKPFVSGVHDRETVLRVLDGEQVVEMDLGTYLLGVVRAEMPASFELEALKAQTVAARTYTRYHLMQGSVHGDTADICTDHTCCQAYQTEERARANWGENAERYEAKIRQAVEETDGETILYNDEPILAVFHSSSAGLTRRAGEVWVNDLPYLQPVSSPEQGESIPNYYSRAEFTAEDLRQRVASAVPEADLSGEPSRWLKEAERDEAGSVVSVKVGGVKLKGSRLRSILGLRSACFEWETTKDAVIFHVTGYGHGVGLSQYGANQMAQNGADHREILTHYYTGVVIGGGDLPASVEKREK